MKKVVILTPSMGMGGMERVLVNYANLFAARGYDVTVLNFTHDEQAIVDNFDPSVHYIKNYSPAKRILQGGRRILPWNTWIRFHSARYLYKKYIRERYDVEIAFFGSEAIKILSGSTNPNAFGWIHNVNVHTYTEALGGMRQTQKVYHEISHLVCVSQQAKEEIERVFKRSENVFVVHNPNDTKLIREKALAETIDTKGVFTFVTVARFYDKQKGFMRQLDVCKRLRDNGFTFNLWLIGDGADFGMVKARAEELGLDNVTLFGQLSNPYPYIRCADMYLCASYHEGFSMVMMEAVILATPMLSTEISGAREMLGDSEYGLVVDNTEDGIYDGMAKVLSDPAYYRSLREQAQKRKDFLCENSIMNTFESLLERTEQDA